LANHQSFKILLNIRFIAALRSNIEQALRTLDLRPIVTQLWSENEVEKFATLANWRLWGAVCKNIISDRFSTKTAISGRDSYLYMQRCYIWQI